ncbi:SDR family oxidoreductase [Bradyrhizobium sp. Cp5.3]|uniref:SDR family oxidoreductase n=1 Tax=Bradyrhizobium sp. Cp5.3 TaxID=443598 RepID=UPI00040F1E8F|nr:SDR family oxidoreductase [Bradyrhizobium sp. Cp5.3]
MDIGVKDKVALVFGAGGGLGGAIAKALAAEGARIALADIAEDAAKATAAEIAKFGGTARVYQWDLADIAGIAHKIAQIESDLGPVDILINNTGGPPPTPAAGQDAALWSKSFESMVLSVIKVTDNLLPGMRARKWGRIITSTSSGVVAPIPNLGISNALRSSLVAWSKTLAREVGADGVTCNIVLPGRIATPRIKFLDEKKAEREKRPVAEVAHESESSIPVGRYGDPTEYGAVVAFLSGRSASYVTGSVIRVDGGLIASI